MDTACSNCGAPIAGFDNRRIADDIFNEIKALRAELKSKGKDPWLDMRGACAYTGLSESTIRRACQQGTLKHSNAIGKLMFKVSWVDRFLEGK